MFHRAVVLPLLILLTLPWLAGCTTLGYYLQAANGQLEILAKKRPLADLIADPATPAPLRARLQTAQAIRAFAISRLELPESDSYQQYADLGRPHAVWVAFAAPRFSLEPVTWCYPIVGCLAYRGYFSQQEAEQFVQERQAEGLETHLAGVSAYSTLGWFADPLLNTFLAWDEARLAELIFHELTHEKLYIPGDTAFNESYAETVGRLGVELWLQETGRTEQIAQVHEAQKDRQLLEQVVAQTRTRLGQLYSQPLAPEAMAIEKDRLLHRALTDYQEQAGPAGRYGDWLGKGLNNARIASLTAYSQWVSALTALYNPDKGMNALHLEVGKLAALSREEREHRLVSLQKGWMKR